LEAYLSQNKVPLTTRPVLNQNSMPASIATLGYTGGLQNSGRDRLISFIFVCTGAESLELLELLDEVLVVRAFSFAFAALLRPCAG
jgi:hypothetical protein